MAVSCGPLGVELDGMKSKSKPRFWWTTAHRVIFCSRVEYQPEVTVRTFTPNTSWYVLSDEEKAGLELNLGARLVQPLKIWDSNGG